MYLVFSVIVMVMVMVLLQCLSCSFGQNQKVNIADMHYDYDYDNDKKQDTKLVFQIAFKMHEFVVLKQYTLFLLHFVAFFHVASLFSTGVDNKKVGVDNEKGADKQHCFPSSCHICRIPTPGALILNHLQEAKTTEKSWSFTTNSKFNTICCWDAAVLHPNRGRQ